MHNFLACNADVPSAINYRNYVRKSQAGAVRDAKTSCQVPYRFNGLIYFTEFLVFICESPWHIPIEI